MVSLFVIPVVLQIAVPIALLAWQAAGRDTNLISQCRCERARGLDADRLIVGVFVLTRRTMRLIDSLEANQIAPAAARVCSILDDIKEMSARVRNGAGWIDGLTARIFHR